LLNVIPSNKFQKDLALARKRGKSMDKIQSIINILAMEKPLPEKYRTHILSGKWKKYYECHIEPDWLLIYRAEDGALELARTGTHSDLF
jgi:mRNA interferase YafQ